MKETGYYFTSPALGEPISAFFQGITARCENGKVFLLSFYNKEEVSPKWYVDELEAQYNAIKADDLPKARKLGDELWEKVEVLRQLQKEAACSGRFDIVDYISSVLNASRFHTGW